MKRFDLNDDGIIAFDEFVDFLYKDTDSILMRLQKMFQLVQERGESVMQSFAFFDGDGDGYITADEMHAVSLFAIRARARLVLLVPSSL